MHSLPVSRGSRSRGTGVRVHHRRASVEVWRAGAWGDTWPLPRSMTPGAWGGGRPLIRAEGLCGLSASPHPLWETTRRGRPGSSFGSGPFLRSSSPHCLQSPVTAPRKACCISSWERGRHVPPCSPQTQPRPLGARSQRSGGRHQVHWVLGTAAARQAHPARTQGFPSASSRDGPLVTVRAVTRAAWSPGADRGQQGPLPRAPDVLLCAPRHRQPPRYGCGTAVQAGTGTRVLEPSTFSPVGPATCMSGLGSLQRMTSAIRWRTARQQWGKAPPLEFVRRKGRCHSCFWRPVRLTADEAQGFAGWK